jgi:predicted glycoside hydrolase/deacetylase ChbG (UPF0249 family)
MNTTRQHMLPRHITVCVDDFGMHEGINQAALDLARRGRISAISCMVDGPAWHAGSNALKGNAIAVEIGLHLNFTENFGQSHASVPLPKLILLAYARLLDRAAIKRDIERQFELFESTVGRMPDFIDGHQHVHQLPVIRAALIDVLDKRYASRKPWLRASCPPGRFAGTALSREAKFKSRLIRWLGASAWCRLARQHGYKQNRHLLGVYGFDAPEGHYSDLLEAWFDSADAGDMLMCHPSVPGPWSDPLLEARSQEYSVLASRGYSDLLGRSGITLAPLQ